MAIKIRNAEVVDFGIFDDRTIVTHARLSTDSVVVGIIGLPPIITIPKGFLGRILFYAIRWLRRLLGCRTDGGSVVPANRPVEFPAGGMEMVFPVGDFNEDGLRTMLTAALANNVLYVDLMTDKSTVVTTEGYSQQSTDKWDVI